MKKLIVLISLILIFANNTFAQDVFTSYTNEQIAHTGETTETLVEYTLINNIENDISVASINLNIYDNDEIQTLRVFADSTLVFETNEVEGWNFCEFSIPHWLNSGDELVISLETDLINNGNIYMELDRIHYIIENSHHEILPGLETEHMVVNINEDMFEFSFWPNDSAIYLFPGQELSMCSWFVELWNNNFHEDDVVAFNYSLTVYNQVNDLFIYMDPYAAYNLNELGQLDYEVVEATHNIFWTANNQNGIGQSNLSKVRITNQMQIGYYGFIHAYINLSQYNPKFGFVDEYHQKTIDIYSNAGVVGDVSGNDIVDYEDYNIMVDHFMHELYWDSRYMPEGEINISRAQFLFNWTTQFDAWLLNIWLNNPDNELVSDLCIGEEFDYEDCVEGSEYTSNQIGNELIISTEGNAVSIYGTVNGEPWTETQFLNSDQVSSWKEGLEPEVIHIDSRSSGEFIFTLPEGLENMEIGSVIIGSSESNTSTEVDTPRFNLGKNYPNPFNPLTSISFEIPSNTFVNLSVYDVYGRLVKVLHNGNLETGMHQINFNGDKLSSGMYFYTLKTSNNTVTKKMMLIK